jgi:proline iminopeptidase
MLRLRTHGELLFYDQRGGGRSKTDDRERITWLTQVEDLGQVLSEWGLEAPTVVGYSWGGLLALLFAIEAAAGRAAPALQRIVLIDPAPVTRQYRDEFEAEFDRRQKSPEVQTLRAQLAESGLRERDAEGYRQRAFELSVAAYFANPGAARDLTPFRVSARVQESVWESLGDFDLLAPGQIDSIRKPALVVHGLQDPVPLASSEACARSLGARLVVIDQCGHVPYVEQPEVLFGAIDTFLG